MLDVWSTLTAGIGHGQEVLQRCGWRSIPNAVEKANYYKQEESFVFMGFSEIPYLLI